jgi:ribonuclease D
LADALAARLAELGRAAWAAEECARLEAVRHAPPAPPEEAFMRVRGARDLDPKGRAVLRELAVFREDEALRLGRPPHYVLSNDAMVALAANPAADPARLGGVGRHARGPAGARLRAALRRGREAAPVPWPAPRGPNPWTPEARGRLVQLKRWRAREAEALGLDPGIVWPAGNLERLALAPSTDPAALDDDDPPAIRAWQEAALGASLRAFLAGLR